MTRTTSPLAVLKGAEWRVIAILLTIYTLAYLDRQIIALLVDPIRKHLGVSDVEIGFLQGLGFTLFYALCGPLIGWAVDRYRRREIIFGGVVVWSLGTMASGFADSYWHLLMARFAVGAGEAALLPAAYSIISDMVDKPRLGRAMGVFSLGAIIGGSLSYVVGGALISLVSQLKASGLPMLQAMAPWQIVFLIIGAAGLPLAFLAFAFPDPARAQAASPALSANTVAQSHFARHWRFYACHFLGFSLFCFLGAAASAWSATYMMRQFHWTVGGIGALLGLKNLIGGSIGMFGGGWLADWLTRRGWQDAHLRMYLWLMPLFALAGITAFLAPNMWVAFGGLAIVAVISPFIAVAAAALQLTTLPDRRGIASASFLLVYNLIGFGLGPALVALASRELFGNSENLGPPMALAFAVLVPAIMLLMALGLRPMRAAVADVATITR